MGTRPDRRLGRTQRLLRSSDFRQAYGQGRRYPGRYMVFWVREADDASLRLGVVAGRRLGDAVDRNRARRRLREAFRRNRFRLEGQYDVILVARPYVLKAKWEEVERELLRLARRAGMLRTR